MNSLKHAYAAAGIVLAAHCSPPVRGDDWPRWLGPERNGVSKETGWLKRWPAEGPPELWRKKTGSGYSGIRCLSH